MHLDVVALATVDGTTVLAYYEVPVSSAALSSTVLLREPSITRGTEECAEHCLRDEACHAFSSNNSDFCQLYLAAPTPELLVSQAGTSLYEKDQGLVRVYLL